MRRVAPTTAVATDDDARLPTLDALRAQLGDGSETEALALLRNPPKNDLVVAGADVSTSRITTDCRRVYAVASQFLASATDAQRARLVAVTPAVLRVAVWAASEGDRLAHSFDVNSTRAKRAKAVRDAAAVNARATAIARRKQLLRVLNALYGDGSAAVATAVGTIDTPENLSASIEALIKLARAALADTSAAAVAARQGVTITAPWLDESAQIGAAALNAGQGAGTSGAKGEVTRGTVDYWDGINLRFFQRVVAGFEAGHDEDATIPVLQPIALRNVMGRKRKKKPTPPTGTGGGTSGTGGGAKG